MTILHKILNDPEFKDNPPVLVDIGASGNIHSTWKKFAKYSICIAFDADDREFGFVTKESEGFKKLYIFNCIVSDKESEKIDFYLTVSPYCSSTLKPNSEKLKSWSFAEKFNLEKVVSLPNTSLGGALKKLDINYVDWFKSDSQGIDVRLFNNLGDSILKNSIVAEFEPGLIDAYNEEDKFYYLLQYMADKPFWIANVKVKGSERITNDILDEFTKNNLLKKMIHFSIKSSPGWVETLYINDFTEIKTRRQFLLGWLFSTILDQHGFAIHLAIKGKQIFNEPLFEKMLSHSKRCIYLNLFKLKFLPAVLTKFKKLFNQD